MKLTYKFLILILLLALLAGCTTAPTPAPTVTATVTPLPTATALPTATLIPTPEPTPAPAALPVPEEPFPTSVTEQLITDERLANQQKDFEILTQNDPAVKTEALRLAERLKAIGGETTTSKNIVDGYRWGVIPSCDGKPCILQKTTDGGTTWAVVPDASAYAELIANPLFAKENYRLAPLGRPVDLQEGATVEVISQNSWLIYAWRDAKSEKILAWYDAAKDQYIGPDGKKLEILEPYTPFSETTTWADCKKNVIRSPLTDPKGFQADMIRFHQYDQQLVVNEDVSLTYIQELAHPIGRAPGDGFLEDYVYGQKLNTSVKPSICASLDGNLVIELPLVYTPINGTPRVYLIPIVFNSTETYNHMIQKFGTQTAQSIYNELYSPEKLVENLKLWENYSVSFLVSEKNIPIDTIPEYYRSTIKYYNYYFDHGFTKILMKANRGEATEEELITLTDIPSPAYAYVIEDNPAITLPEKQP